MKSPQCTCRDIAYDRHMIEQHQIEDCRPILPTVIHVVLSFVNSVFIFEAMTDRRVVESTVDTKTSRRSVNMIGDDGFCGCRVTHMWIMML